MPLYQGAACAIRENLERLLRGDFVPVIPVGCFTEAQLARINEVRLQLGWHELEENEILFKGLHLLKSRLKDGYLVEDMVLQICSAMAHTSIVMIDPKMSCLQNDTPREDGYGNFVRDRAVFEMTARKPRAELFSVMPKGDYKKPPKR